MSIRLRRLKSDYEKIKGTFWNSPYVKVEVLEGDPPYKYLITYNVKGLCLGSAGPIIKEVHKIEIYLPQEYPRENPICTMKTPHFHPNIFDSNNKVCLGKEWAAGEGLVDIIIRIGRMIQYQNYNLDSPANSTAKEWVYDNKYRLPIDNKDIGKLAEIDIHLHPIKGAKGKDDFEIILY